MSEITFICDACGGNGDYFGPLGPDRCAKCGGNAHVARALRAENERLRRLLSEVAEGGVEFADERVRYVAVQIDRETWAEVLALAGREVERG